MTDKVVIAGAARTPMGGFQGAFSGVAAAELGGAAIAASLEGIDAGAVDELLMGCVLPAGQGQAPARQAGFKAGLSQDVPATTLNKMCGSGMKAAMMAHDALALGQADSDRCRWHGEHDERALFDARNAGWGAPWPRTDHRPHVPGWIGGRLRQGASNGHLCRRLRRGLPVHARGAGRVCFGLVGARDDPHRTGGFEGEITPVTVATRKGELLVTEDEQPGNARPEKIPHLKPAFRKDGTVTPANSSSISDGAAALAMTRESVAEAKGWPVRARILGHASHAQEPGWFTTAPVPAARKLMERIGWTVDDVDLWEVNEAFAVVPMAFMHEMGVPHDKLNVNGGACALGHPIGASGARIMVTLLNALEKRDLKRGIAAICIGGGEGTAIAIERP